MAPPDDLSLKETPTPDGKNNKVKQGQEQQVEKSAFLFEVFYVND